MGCCPTGSINRKKPKDMIIDPSKVNETKKRLKAEKLNTSFTPYSEETLNLFRKANA